MTTAAPRITPATIPPMFTRPAVSGWGGKMEVSCGTFVDDVEETRVELAVGVEEDDFEVMEIDEPVLEDSFADDSELEDLGEAVFVVFSFVVAAEVVLAAAVVLGAAEVLGVLLFLAVVVALSSSSATMVVRSFLESCFCLPSSLRA
jgi:hypothetical protein